MANSAVAMGDPGLGLNYAMVVHGEQRFEYTRPIQAGDVLVATSTISEIRQIKSNTMITTDTAIRTEAGEHVCTAHSILVERG
jgi:acyl dehydratase